MSQNNNLTYTRMIPLSIAVMLVLSLLVSVPKASAAAPYTTYGGCVKYIGPIFSKRSVGSIRQKYIDPLVAGRIKTIDALNKRVATLSPDQVAVLSAGLNNDKQTILNIQAQSKTVTDVRVLRDNYCQMIYKTQINQFRGPQVSNLQKLDRRLVVDTKLFNALSKQAGSGRFQAVIDQKIASAKDSITANINQENSLIPATVNATASFDGVNAGNNLPQVSKATFDQLNQNFKTAYAIYNEIIVLKIAGKGFNPNKSLTLVSVNMTKNGQPVANASDANKAIVRIKVGGGKTYERTIARKDKNFVWHVQSTKPL